MDLTKLEAEKMDIISSYLASVPEAQENQFGDYGIPAIHFWGYAQRMIEHRPDLFERSRKGTILLAKGNVGYFVDGGGFQKIYNNNKKKLKREVWDKRVPKWVALGSIAISAATFVFTRIDRTHNLKTQELIKIETNTRLKDFEYKLSVLRDSLSSIQDQLGK